MSYVVSSDIHGKEYQVKLDELSWRPSCYGIVVKDDAILLTKQYGSYHLPGGGVEFGEMPDDTVVREVKEETGIDVVNPRLVKHISGFITFHKEEGMDHRQSILLYFVCEYKGGELSLDGLMEDEKDIAEMAEWIPLSEFKDIQSNTTVDWQGVVKEVLELS